MNNVIDDLISELYVLVSKDISETLSQMESYRYLEIVRELHDCEAEIPFGIEI